MLAIYNMPATIGGIWRARDHIINEIDKFVVDKFSVEVLKWANSRRDVGHAARIETTQVVLDEHATYGDDIQAHGVE